VELERLGPVALRLAAGFHETSVRFPRLRELCKRILGLGSEQRPRAVEVPGWGV